MKARAIPNQSFLLLPVQGGRREAGSVCTPGCGDRSAPVQPAVAGPAGQVDGGGHGAAAGPNHRQRSLLLRQGQRVSVVVCVGGVCVCVC